MVPFVKAFWQNVVTQAPSASSIIGRRRDGFRQDRGLCLDGKSLKLSIFLLVLSPNQELYSQSFEVYFDGD